MPTTYIHIYTSAFSCTESSTIIYVYVYEVGFTINTYLFMYNPQLYVYTLFSTIHVCEVDSALEHHTIM